MIVIGIDPGSTRAGYGIVRFDGQSPSFVDGGLITVSSSDPSQRLVELFNSFENILTTITPDIVGMEKLYFVKNVKTGIEVAQARGVLTLCVARHTIPLYEFTPSEIKQGLTGYGNADKKAMEKMVKTILTIPDSARYHDDTYDALGVALITGYSHWNKKLVGNS